MAAIDQPPAIHCAVVRDQLGDRVRLRGQVVSAEQASGTYSLNIVKSGPAGSSNIRMGGQFSAPANVETFVGLANFNLDPNAKYLTTLSIRVGEKEYACAAGAGDSK